MYFIMLIVLLNNYLTLINGEEEVILNFEIRHISPCDITASKNFYHLSKNQNLIVNTTSKVGAATVICALENNELKDIHTPYDYKVIGEETNNQRAMTAQTELTVASANSGQWSCSFRIGQFQECFVKISIVKEKSDDSTSISKMTITYIAVGVSLGVLLIIAQTWAIFYFRNKAKAAARLERLSTGKNDDEKKEKRVYITTPSLSALSKAKQDDRVESEIYESIDPIQMDPGLRPPEPLPIESDDVYEDPETVKEVFSRGVFLPAKSPSDHAVKPQPPPCSTLPKKKKEKPAEKKEVPNNRPPIAIPVPGAFPLQPLLKPVTKPTSTPAAPAMKIPPKPTTLPHQLKPTIMPHRLKPVPVVAKESAPVLLPQKPVKPAIQALKQVVDSRNTPIVKHPAKRPLPQPAQNSNFVRSPPRPPKPVTMKMEPDQAELSDYSDHEFDEYDVLPQFNIYNR